MRTAIVAGNWKMNGDLASGNKLTIKLKEMLETNPVKNCEVLVFPAFIHISRVVELTRNSPISVGAQDIDSRDNGAVTGGVSAAMLKDIGCRFAIVGHSERRALFLEDDATVAAKFRSALGSDLTPVLCVGESLSERKAGSALEVVRRQLEHVIRVVGVEAMNKALIAYEPVWAIGTGESASPEQADEVHASLRACLSELDKSLGQEAQILYGGSVTAENAAALFAQENIDGALVGGASLKAESFYEICRAASQSVS